MVMNLKTDEIETPIGALLLVAFEDALCALGFLDRWPGLDRALRQRFGAVRLQPEKNPNGASDRLRAYFAGDLAALDQLRVNAGGTPFQQQVWAALRAIPVGRTTSYSDIARAIGSPRAVRAVGAANGSNPVSIVVPCHRVIRVDGRLCGYGGGIQRKRWLLQHEAQIRIA
jgi:methylated-DNA-[protein]-cysteine S-methyltransferase